MFGWNKKAQTVVAEDELRMARSYFGIATHLRRNRNHEALCGSDLLDDADGGKKQALSDEELKDLVSNRQHSNFFFCGGCVSLHLPDFSEEDVYALRH